MLSKKAILEARDTTTKTVKVPEWGGEVNVRTMTGTERDKFEAMFQDEGWTDNFRSKLLAMCIVDGKGDRLFSDKEASELGKKSATPIGRVYEVARKLNGIGVDAEAELEKNSEGEEKGSGTSPSPANSE